MKGDKILVVQTRTTTLYSQSEAISLLNSEGFDITERMLRYWRESGDIPELTRDGLQWYYTERELAAIRLFARRKQKAPEETLFLHIVEEREFDVVGVEVFRVDGKVQILMHLRREGVLIKDFEEGDFNAITRNY